ncbi:hybrid sensor histidine kinase/response regulator [Halopseudomonas salina]|uniref:histidine kinase n=1 Tax=Halopseudomonas salina TaxID=1323744 RepID=A0ABQ1PR42_9GAMM|nr:hybrid sensor histidine kinase/response regulator [Halopseudomonas salina]
MPYLTEPLASSQESSDNAEVRRLRAENNKLRRINAALIERVESSSSQRTESYAAFQHSVELAEQVRERTHALNETMAELQASNRLLIDARAHAERAHHHLSDAIESVSDALVLFDRYERIVLFNSRFAAFWKGTRAEVTAGTSLSEIKRLAVSTGLVTEVDAAADGHVLYQLRGQRWVQVSERLTSEGGLVIMYTDITDLKQSETARREKALAQKTRLLQRTVDSLSQGVAVINEQGGIEVWNGRFLELAGLAPIEPHRPFAEVMDESELELFVPGRYGISGSEQLTCEQRLANGKVLEVRTHPMPTGGYVNTYTDITERDLYAKALLESERWVRLITDHVPALIAYVGEDLTYQFTNKVYDEWYGWRRGESQNKSLRRIHSQEQFARLQPYIERAFQGESVTFEFDECNAENLERYLLRSYVPNRDAQGKVIGIFVLIRDITERRHTAVALREAYQHLEQRVLERTQELTELNTQLRQEISERAQVESRLREAKREAEQANMSKTKFLAAVSHDLLQPLNAARLFTGALLEHEVPEVSAPLIRQVSHSLEDVENLLETLVDISKLDAGVIKPDIAPFKLSELLDNLANEYRQIAGVEGLELHFVGSDAVVRSDAQLLARILRNFLTNAIRYTQSGKLLLGCRRQAHGLRIEVWDTGMGIPEDKLLEIFQEFKRVNPSANTRDRGLGLGLAIVDKIARMLGHRIRVRSWEGRGSVFSVDLPYGQLQTRLDQPSAAPMMQGQRLQDARVWVLDNDASICAAMRTLLEGWGCHVVTALSEEDLASQVDNFHAHADLLIADYHLDNEVNGVDVVATINGRRGHPLPVLLITANYSNDLKLQVRELGHVLMHKPVKPLKLKTAMGHLLATQAGQPRDVQRLR